MGNFDTVKRALAYIDDHLGDPISLESIATLFHFSPYYFHRMFSIIVGKTLAVYIRDRRLYWACQALSESDQPILTIGMDCGYPSAQSFSRAFKAAFGLSPKEYRNQGLRPVGESVDSLIMKFTNRLKGGILVSPKLLKKPALLIAGICGDGDKTAEVWAAFEALIKQQPLNNKLSSDGYEVRICDEEQHIVHVGYLVKDTQVDSVYTVMPLPASDYASFDVYVANGYDSENNAMMEWLTTNEQGYSERLLGNAHYCVEFYDERFTGNEEGSIVEIWMPIKKE
ncbi:MAG: AraC family transcriptional regulator [Clostridia bacterium]|nr:AraC family transcriptional regulator [Clostridia bacterium]